MMDVQELVGLFANQPLALLPERLSILRRILRDPESVGEQEMQAAFGAAKRPKADNGGGIAIIPIMGTIVPRASAFAEQHGFVSAERIGREIAAAVEDDSIRHIVLHMDTPGGNVAGVPELARQVFEARRVKPVTAVADSLMASAGYWIGTAASEVVVTPSGEVGSIGVVALHADLHRMFADIGIDIEILREPETKAEGNMFEPLSTAAREAFQQQLREVYEDFVAAVAEHRGVSPSAVRSGFARGRTALARRALAEGMVDRIATLDQVLAEIRARPDSTGGRVRGDERATVSLDIVLPQTMSARAAMDEVLTMLSAANGGAAGPVTEPPDEPAAPEAKENTMSQQKQDTAAQNGAATQTAAATPTATVAVGQERDAERDRARRIAELCKTHGMPERAAEFIASDLSVEAVGLQILQEQRQNLQAMTAPPVEMTAEDVKRYSICRAIMGVVDRLEGRRVDYDGFEREVSEEIRRKLPDDYKPKGGIFVPTKIRPVGQFDPHAASALWRLGASAMAQVAQFDPAAAGRYAALNTTTATAGGNTVFTEGGDLIDMLRPRMRVAQLGATILTGLSSPVAFPRQTGAGQFTWVDENPGSDLADSDATIGQVPLNPKGGSSTTAYSRQLLIQSSIDIDAFVQNDLNLITALGIDKAAIAGSGAGAEPAGILNAAGVNVVSIGANGGVPTYSHIVDLETEVATDNADIGDLAYLTTPAIRGLLKKTEQFPGTNGMPVWVGQELNGYRAEVSTQVPSNLTKGTGTNLHAILFGVWSQLMIGYFGAYELIVDPFSKKKQQLIELTAFIMVGLALRNPESFAVIKDAALA